MNLLALDTSSLACSVAVQTGDGILHRHEEQAREHTRLLVPMITELIAESGIRLPELDAIILGNGPGSFIGMRIATSVAQGMAYAAGVRVVPVSSLVAVAAQVILEEGASEIAVCQDAHMNEVYLGLYSKSDAGLPAAAAPERLHGQDTVPEIAAAPGRFTAAGFGWQRYPGLLEANRSVLKSLSPVHHPRAQHLLPAGRSLLVDGASVSPEDVVPAYLRQTVAKAAPRTS